MILNLCLIICFMVFFIYMSAARRSAHTLYAAKQGDPEAQYQAALWYYHGKINIKKDWQKVFEYFSLAAQTGHTKALNALGALYRAGHGTPKDETKAFACYQKTAEQSDFEGMINLAVLYRMQKEDKQAFDWLKKAADKGSPLGQRMLAEFYYAGIGTDANEQEGFKYYTLAAQQGEPTAVAFLKKRDPHLRFHKPV